MSAIVPENPSPPTETIDRDCPCITCGYNLRTSAFTARCPECATPATATFRAYADRLAGADRKWLRATTNGILWLALAMLLPALFVLLPFPGRSYNTWLTENRLQLGITLIPAIMAIAGCWRLGSAPQRPRPVHDQPKTRWALRVTALAWLVPLLVIAGPFERNLPPYTGYSDGPGVLIFFIAWCGIPATLLAYRRLGYLARHIPSDALRYQCNVVGSQFPLAVLAIMAFLRRYNGELPDAVGYAMTAPLPAAGIPWPLVQAAPKLGYVRWIDLPVDAGELLMTWSILVHVAAPLLMIQFVIALVRVRRADRDLPGYCRERLVALEPSP
jgi:hypothetical protein